MRTKRNDQIEFSVAVVVTSFCVALSIALGWMVGGIIAWITQ